MSDTTTSPQREKPIWGCQNIAAYIGKSEQATRHLIRTGALNGAVKKVGGVFVGAPAKLREVLGE